MAAKVYGPTILRPDELRACLVKQQSLLGTESALLDMNKKIEAGQQSYKRRESRVESAVWNIGYATPAQIAEHQRSLKRLKRRCRQLSNQIDRYNAELITHEGTVTGFNSTCGGREYYVSDYNLVVASLAI